ncbi:MAG TPA: DUF3073 domain-containing protein [Propionibacterium sp.]|jgi:hypothetical protein|nr:DUF3073 domain-containing protein [Propionibacterium sp.]
MGRGRAKAKQTKVARELKYRSINTDFSSLERELRGKSAVSDDDDYTDEVEHSDIPDAYADLAARYETLDDDYDDYGDLRKSG